MVRSVAVHDIIDDLLSSFITEVHIDIGHRLPLRVQEPLENERVPDRIDVRDLQRICDNASGAAASSGSDRNVMFLRVADEVPHDQEVIDEAHGPNRRELVHQPLFVLLVVVRVPLFETGAAQLLEIVVRGVALRHLEHGQLVVPELDLHVASVRDLLRVLQRLRRVREQRSHLLRRLHVILAALVAHAVLVLHLRLRLDAQKHIVCLPVLGLHIVNIVGAHKRDARLLVHPQKRLVDKLLIRNSVVLQLEEEIALAENALQALRALHRVLIQPHAEQRRNLSREARRQRDQTLVVRLQQLVIHAGFIVKALRKTLGNDLHQVFVTEIIFREKDHMIISLFADRSGLVKP